MPSTEIREFQFHGARLPTFMHNGERWIAMRPVVEAIGVDWKSQHVKLLKNINKFNCGDITTVGADGKRREMTCILVSKFALWLANSINPTGNFFLHKRAGWLDNNLESCNPLPLNKWR